MDIIKDVNHPVLPSRIEPLLQVCSRWRHALINSCSLWTHLDLVDIGHKFHRRLLARAATYATRAGDSPLSLHIYESTYEAAVLALTQFDEFVTLISPRLAAVHSEPHGSPRDHVALFSRSLIHTVPGLLTQLVIVNSSLVDTDFDTAYTSILSPSNESIENAETLRLVITALRLHDMYFGWNSPAYHGLVELSLTFSYPYLLVNETELAEVLRSSPQLKKLWLRIGIVEPGPGSPALEPIALKDLSVLKLRMKFGELAGFLRLIDPGPQPLKMCVTVTESEDMKHPSDNHWSALEQFFTRSSVTMLRVRIRSWVQGSWVPNLLARLPNLKLLALEDMRWFRNMAFDNQTVCCTVGTLSVRIGVDGLDAHIDGLRWLVHDLGTQPVTVGWLNVRLGDQVSMNSWTKEELAGLCSAINCEFIVSDDVPDNYWY